MRLARSLSLALMLCAVPQIAMAQSQNRPAGEDDIDAETFEFFAKVGFGVDLTDVTSASCATARTDFPAPVTVACDGGKAAPAIDAGAGVNWNFGGLFSLEASTGVRKTGTTAYTHTATLGVQEVLRRAEANYTEMFLKVGPRLNLGDNLDLALYYGLFHFFATADVSDEGRVNGTRVRGTSYISQEDGSRHFMLGVVAYVGFAGNPFLRPYFEYTARSFKQFIVDSQNPAGFPADFDAHSLTVGWTVPLRW